MDASVFWGGLYALRDFWKNDKPGLVLGAGLALLLLWSVLAATGRAATLGTVAIMIGLVGMILFIVGLAVWIAYTPRRRMQARRPDR